MSDEYLTVEECAELLQCSAQTIRRAVKRGELPTLELGTVIRIPRSALDAMVGTRPPAVPNTT